MVTKKRLEAAKRYRLTHREKIKAYRTRYYLEHKDTIKAWKQSEVGKLSAKKYRLSPKGKITQYKYQQTPAHNLYHNIWAKKNRIQKNAQLIAIRHIKIPDGQLCTKCSINLAIERHHPDYSKPLEVVLVCRNCHVDIHKKHKNGRVVRD